MSDTGVDQGTVLNSDRQLWSVAGNLAMTYRIFFGLDFATDGLHLQPVVPAAFQGNRVLSNFHYRNSVLSIEVRGLGSNIRAITMDGKRSSPFVTAETTGTHSTIVDLDGQPLRSSKLNLANSTFAPDTPQPTREGNTLSWKAIKGATRYQIYRDGVVFGPKLDATSFAIPQDKAFAQYQVPAMSEAGTASFLSVPVAYDEQSLRVAATGSTPYVTLDTTTSPGLKVNWDAPAASKYILKFHYD